MYNKISWSWEWSNYNQIWFTGNPNFHPLWFIQRDWEIVEANAENNWCITDQGRGQITRPHPSPRDGRNASYANGRVLLSWIQPHENYRTQYGKTVTAVIKSVTPSSFLLHLVPVFMKGLRMYDKEFPERNFMKLPVNFKGEVHLVG